MDNLFRLKFNNNILHQFVSYLYYVQQHMIQMMIQFLANTNIQHAGSYFLISH